MELNDQQKSAVQSWVEEGCGLSEIQRRLAQEYDVSMTFMDVRFLIIDLGLEIKEAKESPSPAKAPAEVPVLDDQGEVPGDGVSVDVDRVMKPGAIVSGTVVFSDGVQAGWMLDQMGRLALDPSQADYRPSEDDVAAFQQALQQELAKRGF